MIGTFALQNNKQKPTMQSIWSVPQTQAQRKKQHNKFEISKVLKGLFIHKKKQQKQPFPFYAQQHNYFSQQQTNSNFPQQKSIERPQIFTQTVATPLMQPSFHHGLNHESVSINEQKGVNIKNLTAIFHILLPIILAVLGIPFYIMVILKLINFVH